MTDEEIRLKVAEAMGWKPDPETKFWYALGPNEILAGFKDGIVSPLPNYPADLNAMHEAEKMLLKDGHESDLWLEYLSNLVICAPAGLSSHATARQRCIAFLKTKGLIP